MSVEHLVMPKFPDCFYNWGADGVWHRVYEEAPLHRFTDGNVYRMVAKPRYRFKQFATEKPGDRL